ncbi:MAG: hypothetical protein MJ252_29065 [archaeon]|nr:hypothetical protein [archaeon]
MADNESVEEYTREEIEELDKWQEYTDHQFEDDELYEVITKYKYNQGYIKEELDQMLKDLKKGDEYGWQTVGKSKINLFIFI